MSEPLPSNADLAKLRDNAKVLRDLVRGGVDGATELVRANHPRMAALQNGSPDAQAFKLADAQLTLARHYGFTSWPKLKARIELMRTLARSPHVEPAGQPADVDRFLRLACLNYGADRPTRPAEALAVLAGAPEVAGTSIHTAAAAGDPAATQALLATDPTLANLEGGPFRWPPLLYLTYSRIEPSGSDPLTVAALLLDAGADPDAGFLWEGLIPPFTALTGVFGGGEQRQPAHTCELALARLLLEAGADPNDGQTVYNRGMGDIAHDDTEWLELLVSFGFGHGEGGPWHRLFGPPMAGPAGLLTEALHHAAEFGLVNRVRPAARRGGRPEHKLPPPDLRRPHPLPGCGAARSAGGGDDARRRRRRHRRCRRGHGPGWLAPGGPQAAGRHAAGRGPPATPRPGRPGRRVRQGGCGALSGRTGLGCQRPAPDDRAARSRLPRRRQHGPVAAQPGRGPHDRRHRARLDPPRAGPSSPATPRSPPSSSRTERPAADGRGGGR